MNVSFERKNVSFIPFSLSRARVLFLSFIFALIIIQWYFLSKKLTSVWLLRSSYTVEIFYWKNKAHSGRILPVIQFRYWQIIMDVLYFGRYWNLSGSFVYPCSLVLLFFFLFSFLHFSFSLFLLHLHRVNGNGGYCNVKNCATVT